MDESKEFFLLQEDAAHRTAQIIGPASAAQQALNELERRRAAGEDSVVWCYRGRWIVGPRPEDA